MRKWTVRAARVVLVGAAFAAIGGGVASADTTSGQGSILGGNQIQVPISVPIDASGDAIAVLGRAVSGGGAGTSSAAVNYRDRMGAGASSSTCPGTCSAPTPTPAPACQTSTCASCNSCPTP